MAREHLDPLFGFHGDPGIRILVDDVRIEHYRGLGVFALVTGDGFQQFPRAEFGRFTIDHRLASAQQLDAVGYQIK